MQNNLPTMKLTDLPKMALQDTHEIPDHFNFVEDEATAEELKAGAAIHQKNFFFPSKNFFSIKKLYHTKKNCSPYWQI